MYLFVDNNIASFWMGVIGGAVGFISFVITLWNFISKILNKDYYINKINKKLEKFGYIYDEIKHIERANRYLKIQKIVKIKFLIIILNKIYSNKLYSNSIFLDYKTNAVYIINFLKENEKLLTVKNLKHLKRHIYSNLKVVKYLLKNKNYNGHFFSNKFKYYFFGYEIEFNLTHYLNVIKMYLFLDNEKLERDLKNNSFLDFIKKYLGFEFKTHHSFLGAQRAWDPLMPYSSNSNCINIFYKKNLVSLEKSYIKNSIPYYKTLILKEIEKMQKKYIEKNVPFVFKTECKEHQTDIWITYCFNNTNLFTYVSKNHKNIFLTITKKEDIENFDFRIGLKDEFILDHLSISEINDEKIKEYVCYNYEKYNEFLKFYNNIKQK